MDIDKLVRMANSIGHYFAAYPDRDEAMASIAKHIEMFWTPQMRRELLNHATQPASAHGLQALVADALAKHRLQPGPPLDADA